MTANFKKTQHLAKVFGANVARRRQLLKMSQAELSEKLDITPDVVSRVENGYISPRFGRIEQIAAALGCTVSELFREQNAEVSVMASSLAEMLYPLPSSKREELVSLIAQLIRILHEKD